MRDSQTFPELEYEKKAELLSVIVLRGMSDTESSPAQERKKEIVNAEDDGLLSYDLL